MGLTFHDSNEGCVSRTVEVNLVLSLGEEQVGGTIPHFLLDLSK